MAATFSSFRTITTPIVCAAAPANHSRKSNSNWWAPIFGFSSEPDYIINGAAALKIESGQETHNESGRVRPDPFKGCFTEEKARELRKKTIESSTFHDIMYHSAIASRLASDVSGQN